MHAHAVNAQLVQWGERLFYPANRIVRADPARLTSVRPVTADWVRARIEATVVRRLPQAIVRFTGGGRGLRAIAAHFAYISRGGALDLEDDRGLLHQGRDGLRDLVDQWRHAGSRIDPVSQRREAFNLVLSAPPGSDAARQLDATRAFAHATMKGHRFVMAQHTDRPHPHVHLCVRYESRAGVRMTTWNQNHAWRWGYVEALRERGIDVDTTSQSIRGGNRRYEPLWQHRARQEGRLRHPCDLIKSGDDYLKHRLDAMLAWSSIMDALAASENLEDRQLANAIASFVRDTPFYQDLTGVREHSPTLRSPTQRGPEIEPAPADRTLTR